MQVVAYKKVPADELKSIAYQRPASTGTLSISLKDLQVPLYCHKIYRSNFDKRDKIPYPEVQEQRKITNLGFTFRYHPAFTGVKMYYINTASSWLLSGTVLPLLHSGIIWGFYPDFHGTWYPRGTQMNLDFT